MEVPVGLTSDQAEAAAMELLLEAGISQHFAQRLRGRPFPGGRAERGPEDGALAAHFAMLTDAAFLPNGGGGRSGHGSSEQYRRSFRTEGLIGEVAHAQNDFEMILTERQDGRQRVLTVIDRSDGYLKIDIALEESMVRLTQRPDGSVVWLAGPFGEMQRRTAANYAALYQNDPDAVERELLWLWQAYGLVAPATRHDALVHEVLVERIRGQLPDNQQTAARLIAELNSDEFQVRQDAYTKLRQQLPVFREALDETLRQADLSPEVRQRVTELVRTDQEMFGEPVAAIERWGLLSDEPYLSSVALRVEGESRALVSARIAALKQNDVSRP
jgi:hypothetical protein